MAACSYTTSSSSWLSLGTYAPSYLGGFSSAIGALVVGEVAALRPIRPRRRWSEQTGMKGAARLARHQEGKQTDKTGDLSLNAPRAPARAYQGTPEAIGGDEKVVAARTAGCASCWRPLGPQRHSAHRPIAMDEEASWRRLGAQVLWYRRDNLASNLKLLAVTQLVRNRTRAA